METQYCRGFYGDNGELYVDEGREFKTLDDAWEAISWRESPYEVVVERQVTPWVVKMTRPDVRRME